MLKLKMDPILAVVIGLPVIFTGAGLGLIFGFAEATTLTCQRDSREQGQCELKTLRGPFSWQSNKVMPLQDIKTVKIQGQRQISSGDRTYLLMVETQNGEFSLQSAEYPELLQPNAVKLGTFLDNKEQTKVEITTPDMRWLLYLIGGLFMTIPTAICLGLLYSMLNPGTQVHGESVIDPYDEVTFDDEFSFDDECSFGETFSFDEELVYEQDA